MNNDMIQVGSDMPDMPDNLEDMTMKEVKDWVAKQQEISSLKKQAIQKLCWDEIREVCKKYNCMIKPVVKLNEMQDGQYTFYGDLVVIAMELPDEQSDTETNEKSSEKEPNGQPDTTEQTGKREGDGKENDEV